MHAASEKHKVSRSSSPLSEPSAGLFHRGPPTSLFSSLILSFSLWSPAALDSLSALKSSLALLACQAADGTNSYLRSCAPLPPPTSRPPDKQSPPPPPPPPLKLLHLTPTALSSLLLSSIIFFFLFFQFMLTFSPFPLFLPATQGYMLGTASCCSNLLGDRQRVQVCVCHLVATARNQQELLDTHRDLGGSMKECFTLRSTELSVTLTHTHTIHEDLPVPAFIPWPQTLTCTYTLGKFYLVKCVIKSVIFTFFRSRTFTRCFWCLLPPVADLLYCT